MKKYIRRVNRNEKAFTLIELILVVALMAIAVGVTGDILVSLIRSYNKSQVLNEIEQNTNFIAQKMEKELRNATAITYLDPNGSSPPSANSSFNQVTFSTRYNNTSITYEVDNYVLYRKVGDDYREALTSTEVPGGVNVECMSYCFRLLSSDPQVLEIDLKFTQSGNNQAFSGEIELESTIVIRDTY